MIITDQEVLRKKSKEVTGWRLLFVKHIIKQLEKELNKKGYGLAAIQLGIPYRIAIIRFPNGEKLDLINPIIINKKKKREFSGEGCLSIPGQRVTTERYSEIVLENLNKKYVLLEEQAQIVQHEIDHMDGILITDRKVKRNNKVQQKHNYFRHHLRRKIKGR